MKKVLSMLGLCCFSMLLFAQSKVGLHGVYLAKNGQQNELWLFADGYGSHISYENNTYGSTYGGPVALTEEGIRITIEYNDANPQEVGQTKNIKANVKATGLQIGSLNYTKQTAKKQDLDGLWRITGRKQEDKMSTIKRGDRKTIKLLVDGYFQWIAINPAEKGFYGTGGGQYSFANGKYVEHILFFSRDNGRVGAKLDFTGELKNGEWHHSGKSSKGDPIYEIWSRDRE